MFKPFLIPSITRYSRIAITRYKGTKAWRGLEPFKLFLSFANFIVAIQCNWSFGIGRGLIRLCLFQNSIQCVPACATSGNVHLRNVDHYRIATVATGFQVVFSLEPNSPKPFATNKRSCISAALLLISYYWWWQSGEKGRMLVPLQSAAVFAPFWTDIAGSAIEYPVCKARARYAKFRIGQRRTSESRGQDMATKLDECRCEREVMILHMYICVFSSSCWNNDRVVIVDLLKST